MDSMTLKLGQVQLMVGRDKAENLRRACALIRRAAEQGAPLVMLPEMFCCPSENEMFRPNSEEQGGRPSRPCRRWAGGWASGS